MEFLKDVYKVFMKCMMGLFLLVKIFAGVICCGIGIALAFSIGPSLLHVLDTSQSDMVRGISLLWSICYMLVVGYCLYEEDV